MKHETKSPFPGFLLGCSLLALLACGGAWFVGHIGDEIQACMAAVTEISRLPW